MTPTSSYSFTTLSTPLGKVEVFLLALCISSSRVVGVVSYSLPYTTIEYNHQVCASINATIGVLSKQTTPNNPSRELVLTPRVDSTQTLRVNSQWTQTIGFKRMWGLQFYTHLLSASHSWLSSTLAQFAIIQRKPVHPERKDTLSCWSCLECGWTGCLCNVFKFLIIQRQSDLLTAVVFLV